MTTTRATKTTTSQCLVTAADYRRHWGGELTPEAETYRVVTYNGEDRRVERRDRRWAATGGRRRTDRKR